MTKISENQAYRIAFEIMYYHEYFHFLVDICSTINELIIKKPLYIPYLTEIYQVQHLSANNIEESLANAYVLNKRQKFKESQIRAFLKNFMDLQPPAYSGYYRFLIRGKPGNYAGKRKLISMILETRLNPSISPPLENLLSEHTWHLTPSDVPIYIVEGDISHFSWYLHFAPPKLKPQIINCLQKKGIKFRQGKGSEIIAISTSGERVRIGTHGDRIGNKAFNKLLKMANMSRKEFFRECV